MRHSANMQLWQTLYYYANFMLFLFTTYKLICVHPLPLPIHYRLPDLFHSLASLQRLSDFFHPVPIRGWLIYFTPSPSEVDWFLSPPPYQRLSDFCHPSPSEVADFFHPLPIRGWPISFTPPHYRLPDFFHPYPL